MELTAEKIWQLYQNDVSYKSNIELYDKVKNRENMFIGRQWEGLVAPDLEKPVLNVIKRVANYLISVLLVNDVGISFRDSRPPASAEGQVPDSMPMEDISGWQDIIADQMEIINENVGFRDKLRYVLRDAVVRGDGAIYTRFEPGEKGGGKILRELVDNTHIHFANQISPYVEEQPYIIISRSELTASLKEQFPGFEDEIKPDFSMFDSFADEKTSREYTTVLVYLHKVKGKVHFCECTQNCMLKGDTDSGLTLYPLAFFNWERVKDCYHGIGAVEEIIPNQVAINKLWALALIHAKNMAFPKIFYDATKLKNWTNKVGAAIGVIGNPNEAIASSFKGYDMSAQVLQLVDQTVSYTKEFMGANDAALGNVNPNNTSAIVALQKGSSRPLELQRQSFYRFIEDYVRIVYEIMRKKYGMRYVKDPANPGMARLVNFSRLPEPEQVIVDIGAADYWSEITQTATMDNLYRNGILTDRLTYIESIPDKNIKNKEKIVAAIRQAQRQRQLQAQLRQNMQPQQAMIQG